ncbi:unnamed protein product [Closterium sp. Naga37s-1]|nr:unnamed protein product [Closterium sp. Naga37s-1]
MAESAKSPSASGWGGVSLQLPSFSAFPAPSATPTAQPSAQTPSTALAGMASAFQSFGSAFQSFAGTVASAMPPASPQGKAQAGGRGAGGHADGERVQEFLETLSAKSQRGGGGGGEEVYDPAMLTDDKKQWKELQSVNSRNRLLEADTFIDHFVVVGLHPEADLSSVEAAFATHKRGQLNGTVGYSVPPPAVNLDAQLLYKYPPRKKLALSPSDLPGFCFPNGVEARCMEKTPSMKGFHQSIYGQAYQTADDNAYVFLLAVDDNATLYGVCMVVHEVVQRLPSVLAMNNALHGPKPAGLPSKYLVTAPRCYCFLTRLPFFDLHFEVLNT